MNFGFNSNEEIEGYLVGLIIGDGHIEPKTNRTVIASNNRDFVSTISSFLDKLDYKYSVFNDKSATVWKISINSEKLHRDLTDKYGIPAGNKTFADFKPVLSEIQLNCFVAGIFDAEGWSEKDKSKYLKVRVKMKNHAITSYIRKILEDKGFQPKGHRKTEGSFVVEVNKQPNVRKFFDTFNLLHPKWLLVKKSSFAG